MTTLLSNIHLTSLSLCDIHAAVKPYIPYDIVPSFYKLPMATAANGSKLPARDLVVPEWIVGEICGHIDPSVRHHGLGRLSRL